MKTWLFRPFDRIAGGPALALGLVVIVITAVVAWQAGMVTDGVLDLHFVEHTRLSKLLAMGFANWLLLAAALLIAGHWLTATRYRLVDLLGTQALARWPMLAGAGYMSIPAVGRETERLTIKLMEAMPSEPHQVVASMEYLLDALWLTLISLPVLALIVWMVWLMYHGYALVFNLRGWRAVVSFIIALVAAEIVSKFAAYWIV